MKIKTNSGKVYDIRIIRPDIMRKDRVLIELEDGRTLAEIAAEFDGLESFRKYSEDLDGVYETYEGFKHLVSISRAESGRVRLTLAKE